MKYTGRHTYLFEAGKWKAIGTYFDDKGYPVSVTGESTLEIQQNIWILKGFTEIQLDEPVKIFNTYQIEPFPDDRDFTRWTSENPALGTLTGYFTVVNDTIISQYHSKDRRYSGTEILLFIDADQYQNWGAAYEDERKMSSWEVMLERI